MFHVKLDGVEAPTLPEDAVSRLRLFHGLLRDKAVPLGAISDGDRDRLWERHIGDSLRAISCLGPEDSVVTDLGSGAGLPGIPLAVSQPERRFVLVERSQRRAAFLELAVDELDLGNVTVECRSIEDISGRETDVCVARALAGPAESWRLAHDLLLPGGRLLYYAGRSWDERLFRGQARGELLVRVCVEGRFDWQGPIVMMAERT